MRGLLITVVLVVLLLPLAVSTSHLPAPQNVRVEAESHLLRIHWDAVDDDRVAGYAVLVFNADGTILDRQNVTGTSTTSRDVSNDNSYAIQVAARDAQGVVGAWSTPAAGTPTVKDDHTYLALGLIVLWAAIWLYALMLTRIERRLQTQLDRIQTEKRRLGDQP